PAAPPPSFSERTYRRTTPNKSTHQIRKNREIRLLIDFLIDFCDRRPIEPKPPPIGDRFAQQNVFDGSMATLAPSFSPVPR
ncbi:hypothetical protein ACI2J4_14495, partial [Agrobacterium tumefaciens]|uniref:hypothetical protein n=1 Tax=Agrobacterium tumefaciens TaxID=358 RepID=UPI00384E53B6